MKATGIVRRIDDLGRVVIPKEIRRTLRIREADPLEIFTDREGEIILKKYSPIGELSQFAGQLAESLAQTCGSLVCVCDMDQVIAVSGTGKKEFEGAGLTKAVHNAIQKREVILSNTEEADYVSLVLNQPEDYKSMVLVPIICEGDVVGAVSILSKEKKKKTGETELKLASCAAAFLGKQMEQ